MHGSGKHRMTGGISPFIAVFCWLGRGPPRSGKGGSSSQGWWGALDNGGVEVKHKCSCRQSFQDSSACVETMSDLAMMIEWEHGHPRAHNPFTLMADGSQMISARVSLVSPCTQKAVSQAASHIGAAKLLKARHAVPMSRDAHIRGAHKQRRTECGALSRWT